MPSGSALTALYSRSLFEMGLMMGPRRLGPAVRFLAAEQFRCLVLGVCGCHLGFHHGVSAFAHQFFIDGRVIVFGGSACHDVGPSAG
ncbi:hypothetical protein ADL12_27225 [Streptomyces regalis]|uniref:Uncharacterized protein n=1 Tax=Streptomyces regalis TaxID=68262 RepID=A0A117MQM3_9ACTN|nr:hypothetical protein ADL12_27225 [Streptomyces regalis]